MKRSAIRLLLWLVLLAPIVVSSNEAVNPTYRFIFTGYVRDTEGLPLSDEPVTVLRDVVYLPGGWGYLLSDCDSREEGRPFVTLTRNGYFSLYVEVCSAPESLSLAVVRPDTILMGSRMQRITLPHTRKNQRFTHEEDGFFCDRTTATTLPVSYVYSIDSLTLVVPTPD